MLSSKEMKQVIACSEEPKVTAEETDMIIRILDSDYHKANLSKKVVAKAMQLTKRQQLSLIKLLQKNEELFDGMLGKKWNTEPVHIELHEYAKPVSSRYYPVTKINKETFRIELNCLVGIAVLTQFKIHNGEPCVYYCS
jgi:hypothetical protein